MHHLTFASLKILTTPNGITIHQQPYTVTLQLLVGAFSFNEFHSLRSKLSWATQTHADLAGAVALASQTTGDNFNTDFIRSLSKVVMDLRSTRNIHLKFPKLRKFEIYIRDFLDSSFANKKLHAQLGYIIFTCNEYNCDVLNFSSRKSRRIVRSIPGDKVHDLADACDITYTLNSSLLA